MNHYTWRILLVDDDEDDYFIVREMLSEIRKDHFLLEWAPSFASGYKALEENEFDVVLVDYDLGPERGTELIQMTSGRKYPAPLILLTGRGSYDVDIEAMHSGAADYLNKSEITPGYLERSIRYAIENKRNQISLAEANQELENKNQQLLGLFTHTPAALALYEPQEPFRVIMHNELYQSTLREPFCKQGVVGLSLEEFELPQNREPILLALRQAVDSSQGQTIYDDLYLDPSGNTTWWDWHINPIMSKRKVTALVHMAVNVTEQHLAREARVELANQMEVQRRLLEQREMERMNVARDLHDGPLQELTAMQFAIQEAIAINEKDERITRLKSVQAMLINNAQEIRTFCNELRPPALAPFGLEKAIRSHIDGYRDRHPDLHVHLDLAPDRQTLPESTRMALFRIFQEVLNNIAKHAHASEVWISLALDPEVVEMEIHDNGVGFRVPRDWVGQARSGHLGLVGMRERAMAAGGEIEFISEPGKGSRVKVTVPRVTE